MNGMENSKKLLSICIPTYNRTMILEESLVHLVPRVKGLDIQIIVVDNASTDSTQEVVGRYNNDIIYIRNEENIGGDMNILKSYLVASRMSEYVCVLGDSYRFKYDLDDLMNILAPRDLDLVVLDRDYKCIDINKSRYYNNVDNLLVDLGGLMDLVGSIVIRSEAIKEENYAPYLWGNFIHFGMTFQYLASLDSVKCYYMKEQVLYHTAINKMKTSWYKDSLKIFTKTWMLTVLSLPGAYSIDSKLISIRRHDFYTGLFGPRQLIHLRVANCLFYKDVRQYRAYIPFVTDTSISYIYAISILPKCILSGVMTCYKYCKKRK